MLEEKLETWSFGSRFLLRPKPRYPRIQGQISRWRV